MNTEVLGGRLGLGMPWTSLLILLASILVLVVIVLLIFSERKPPGWQELSL